MSTGVEAAVTLPPAPRDGDDSALMARVRDGEVTLLGELFERHHQALFGFFSRLVRNPATAEDLVQEVFVRMLKYRHTFRSDAELAPWMYALARNAATDFHRAKPKELQEDPEGPDPVAHLPHPTDVLQRSEQTRTLRRALDRLPSDKRETLLLARFSGLSYESIGELLGISEVAVKGRVHRALCDLRKAYQRCAPKEKS